MFSVCTLLLALGADPTPKAPAPDPMPKGSGALKDVGTPRKPNPLAPSLPELTVQCADFAAWAWQKAGMAVPYGYGSGDLNAGAISFYHWGVAHGTWHPVDSGYTPQPGDVAVYGLDTSAVTAVHVAVVIAATGNDAAPDVINGDGDRTGYSVVEVGDNQAYADVKGRGAPLSGYVSPLAPPAAA